MKKIATFVIAALAILFLSSCEQKVALTLTPSSVTVKVGQQVMLHPGIQGNADFSFSDIKIIEGDINIAYMDRSFNVEGVKPGKTQVGIAILNDKDDVSKGFKYTAYSDVTVTE